MMRMAIACVVGIWSLSAAAETDGAPSPLVMVFLGDSITEGFGLPEEDALPARLEAALAAEGYDIEIRNAGSSGDTTSGGRERLDWSVGDDVDAVFIALGGNDALRALPPKDVESNLDAMIVALKTREIAVILAGMLAPPNYGPDYGAEFNGLYPRLAEKHDLPFYPFLLDGVAAEPRLNQPDGIHPNAAGVAAMVERLAPFLAATLFAGEARQ